MGFPEEKKEKKEEERFFKEIKPANSSNLEREIDIIIQEA